MKQQQEQHTDRQPVLRREEAQQLPPWEEVVEQCSPRRPRGFVIRLGLYVCMRAGCTDHCRVCKGPPGPSHALLSFHWAPIERVVVDVVGLLPPSDWDNLYVISGRYRDFSLVLLDKDLSSGRCGSDPVKTSDGFPGCDCPSPLSLPTTGRALRVGHGGLLVVEHSLKSV